MTFPNPAKNAQEAVQWLYFGYLAAIKTQNGAAMSVGRISPSWTSTLSEI
jgi:pyruvate-formate lyase